MDNLAGLLVEACVSELCSNLFAGAQSVRSWEIAQRDAGTKAASPLTRYCQVCVGNLTC